MRQSLTAFFYPCKVANELADWSIQISPALGPPVSSPRMHETLVTLDENDAHATKSSSS